MVTVIKEEEHLDYIICYHITTAGKQHDDLGSDETGIILITIGIFDISTRQVLLMEQYKVQLNNELPTLNNNTFDRNKYISDECFQETGLSEDQLIGSKPLNEVLDNIDETLKSFKLNHSTSCKFTLVTDGQLPLRLSLHPQMIRENIQSTNYPYYFEFVDLKKQYKLQMKKDKSLTIDEMIADSEIVVNSAEVNFGNNQCSKMIEIVRQLTEDGYLWNDIEQVSMFYNSAIIKKTDVVSDDEVVRARGLPWQATDSDISKFFRGLNIGNGGIALVLSKVGRRNGEALIRFESRDHRDLALRKHKHHMGQRYIEVYMATGRDFIQIAGGETEEAEIFLRKLHKPSQSLIRMRGLPYTATVNQILEFFESSNCHVDCGEEGVLFVNHADGRATGDAFVIFATESEAEEALKSHRENMGNRYIELFKSTPAEVNQVMNSVLNSSLTQHSAIHHNFTGPVNLFDESALFSTLPIVSNGLISLLPHFTTQASFGQSTAQIPLLTNIDQICQPGQIFVRIVGMPLEANVADIINFLEQYSQYISVQGVHIVFNNLGQPAGEAIVQMNSEQAALATVEAKSHQLFTVVSGKKSMVELTALSSWDLSHFSGFIQPSASTIQNALFQLQFFHKQIPAPSAGSGININQLAYPNYWPILPPGLTSATAMPHLAMQNNSLNLVNNYLCGLTNPLTSISPSSPIHYNTSNQHHHHQHNHHHNVNHQPGQTIATPIVANPSQYSATSQHNFLPLGNHSVGSATSPTLFIPNINFISQGNAAAINQDFTTVVLKNLPRDVTGDEIVGIFEPVLNQGISISDLKIGISHEGSPTGEAFVTFTNRLDAEKSLNLCNNKVIRSAKVELSLF